MKLTEFLNDDTCQILLAIIVGIVICYFIFGCSGSCSMGGCSRRDGFSVGGQNCEDPSTAVGEMRDLASNLTDACGSDAATCSDDCNTYVTANRSLIAGCADYERTSGDPARYADALDQIVESCSRLHPSSPPPLDEGQIRTRRQRELYRDVHRFAVDLLTPLAQNSSFTRSNSDPPITDKTDVEHDLDHVKSLEDSDAVDDDDEAFQDMVDLSLIHISEPTRPY